MQMTGSDGAVRQQGWEVWYLRDALVLSAFLEQRCRAMNCSEACEDILQETFVAGFKNVSCGRYIDQGTGLCGYLYGIAKNLLSETLRHQKKESIKSGDGELEMGMVPSFEDTLFLDEIRRLVREAHDHQSPLYQWVIDGYYMQGRSPDDLAVELGKTAGNIRVIAHRAVNEIAKDLERRHQMHISSKAIRAFLEIP
jgi:RNA polymerase sigma factor (sigma-70 family)